MICCIFRIRWRNNNETEGKRILNNLVVIQKKTENHD